MIILEDDLEKLMVSKEPTELTLEGYQDLSDRLHQLQPHMQASSGCWEDTVGQVQRMLRRVHACPGDTCFSRVSVSAFKHRLPPSFTTIQDY